MAKRGYKLQEFLAHSANVNCLNIGKKACRLFITGGDDHKVNVWTIGKPTSIMSLSGHTSPVESVGFDSAEVLVLAGSSTGVIKQWDLEEGKVVRTLTGDRSNCTAVEFHPFGEFFASGSMDTNLRVWDLRKKGCIHTYRGHTQGVSTIKFTPDGRWVVSGGLDNVVKVWDLTAGKLLHDFKFHDGHIRSLDFHPLEFLLATGSADRTVKFWDLETFEMIGSTRPEASGVRAITFHPDGRTLFSGLEDSLKVYSWEPVISHDAVDVGWSTLGDLCIHDGKLLGCSYYRNSVGVWVADISLIEPYGDGSQNDCMEQKFDLKLQESSEKLGSGGRTSSLRCRSPDYDTKDIKNIYVDSTGGKPVGPQKVESLTSPNLFPHIDSKDTSDQPTTKQSPTFVVPSIVPRDTPDGKDSVNSTRESITFSRTKRGMLLRPAHIRRPSNSKNDVEKLPSAFESGTFGIVSGDINSASDPKCQTKGVTAEPRESYEERNSSINNVAEKLEKVLSPQTPVNQEICNKALDSSKETHSVKFVNGVAVVRGRTRSLVERFEKRERVNTIDDQATDISNRVIPEMDKTHPTPEKTHPTPEKTHPIPEKMHPKTHSTPEKMHPTPEKTHPIPEKMHPKTHSTPEKTHPKTHSAPEKTHPMPVKTHPTPEKTHPIPEKMHPKTHSALEKTHPTAREEPQVSRRDSAPANERDASEVLMQNHDVFLSTLRSRLTKLQVVRHFWERNDIKSAIGALRKLPDHSVQADIVSVLMEKRDILTLDLFSCLLPVLLGLLDSKIERHATVSLELLLKLVAVFGSVIQTAISTPRAVGVDLHAEQRIACCNECSIQLQKIQKILPSLVRKGGLVAKSALELSLVLQVS